MGFINKVFRGDKVVWVVFMFLCLISIIEVFSAASSLTYKSGNYWAPITGHCQHLFLGVLLVYAVHLVPYRFFKAVPLVVFPVSIVLLLYVLLKGELTNNAARWFTLFGVQFQPSELAKVSVIMGTALILSRMQDEKSASPKAFRYILVMALIACALIAPENLSTAALLFCVVLLMMYIGRVPLRQIGRLLLVGGLGVGLLVSVLLLVPRDTLASVPGMRRLVTWQTRVKDFGHSTKVPAAKFVVDDKNAQVAHANIAIAFSNVIGRGPGNSVERDFLPQAFSDYIFAIIIEELGLAGGAFVVFLYLVLLFRAGIIARKCETKFPAFLVMGCALMLVSQAIMNMMVAVGLFPVTGQPLPLISRGGTATIINCCYIGMMLSVSYYTEKRAASNTPETVEETEKDIPSILREEVTK